MFQTYTILFRTENYKKNEDSHDALADQSTSENTMDGNPWLVKNVQAFSFLNCPECTFKVKDENLFQDHAIKNHSLSSVLFGASIKTECVYIKTEPNEDITEHPTIETEPNEDVTDHQMIQTEPDEDIMEQHMIKTELNEGITEPRIIDLLENVVADNKHQIIEPLSNVKEIKNEPLEETIYPDFEKASTSQANPLKRSIGTVETGITIEIPSLKKKMFYCATPDESIQDGKSAVTLDQINIQQTIERDKGYVGKGVDKNVDFDAENTVKIQFNPKGLDKAVDKAVKVQFNPKGYLCKGVGKTVYKCVDKGVDKTVDKTVDKAVDKAVKIQFNPKGYLGKGVDKIVDKGVDKGFDKNVDKCVEKGVKKGVDKKYYISAQVLDRVVNKKI